MEDVPLLDEKYEDMINSYNSCGLSELLTDDNTCNKHGNTKHLKLFKFGGAIATGCLKCLINIEEYDLLNDPI